MGLVYQKKNTVNWVKYFKQRVRKNKNFIGLVMGPTGSGKTYSALSIAEQSDPNFNIKQVVFTGKELMALMNSEKLKKGSVIVFEEVGIELDASKWQSTANQMIKYLLETFRHRNFILLMTTPYMGYLAKGGRMLLHGVFETQSIDVNKKTCKLKPMLLQYNSRRDKTYWKYLRVKTEDGIKPLTRWNVPLPSPELIKKYEERKSEFTKQLYLRITKELNEQEGKKVEKYPMKCDKCGHTWESRNPSPPKCSKCSSTLTKRENALENGDLELKMPT